MDVRLEIAEEYAKEAKNTIFIGHSTYYMIRAIYFLLTYYLPKMITRTIK